MKTAVEHIEVLRYKLRMFGIPIEGPTNVSATTTQFSGTPQFQTLR